MADALQRVHSTLTQMQKNLECAICLELLRDPVLTKCEHHFCNFCVLALLQSKRRPSAPCPLCKEPITKRGLIRHESLKNIVDAYRNIVSAVEEDTGQMCTPPRGPVRFSQPEPPSQRPKPAKKSGKRSNVSRGKKKDLPAIPIHLDPAVEDEADENLPGKLATVSNNIRSSFPSTKQTKDEDMPTSLTALRMGKSPEETGQVQSITEPDILDALADGSLGCTRVKAAPESRNEYNGQSRTLAEKTVNGNNIVFPPDPYEFIASQKTPKKVKKRVTKTKKKKPWEYSFGKISRKRKNVESKENQTQDGWQSEDDEDSSLVHREDIVDQEGAHEGHEGVNDDVYVLTEGENNQNGRGGKAMVNGEMLEAKNGSSAVSKEGENNLIENTCVTNIEKGVSEDGHGRNASGKTNKDYDHGGDSSDEEFVGEFDLEDIDDQESDGPSPSRTKQDRSCGRRRSASKALEAIKDQSHSQSNGEEKSRNGVAGFAEDSAGHSVGDFLSVDKQVHDHIPLFEESGEPRPIRRTKISLNVQERPYYNPTSSSQNEMPLSQPPKLNRNHGDKMFAKTYGKGKMKSPPTNKAVKSRVNEDDLPDVMSMIENEDPDHAAELDQSEKGESQEVSLKDIGLPAVGDTPTDHEAALVGPDEGIATVPEEEDLAGPDEEDVVDLTMDEEDEQDEEEIERDQDVSKKGDDVDTTNGNKEENKGNIDERDSAHTETDAPVDRDGIQDVSEFEETVSHHHPVGNQRKVTLKERMRNKEGLVACQQSDQSNKDCEHDRHMQSDWEMALKLAEELGSVPPNLNVRSLRGRRGKDGEDSTGGRRKGRKAKKLTIENGPDVSVKATRSKKTRGKGPLRSFEGEQQESVNIDSFKDDSGGVDGTTGNRIQEDDKDENIKGGEVRRTRSRDRPNQMLDNESERRTTRSGRKNKQDTLAVEESMVNGPGDGSINGWKGRVTKKGASARQVGTPGNKNGSGDVVGSKGSGKVRKDDQEVNDSDMERIKSGNKCTRANRKKGDRVTGQHEIEENADVHEDGDNDGGKIEGRRKTRSQDRQNVTLDNVGTDGSTGLKDGKTKTFDDLQHGTPEDGTIKCVPETPYIGMGIVADGINLTEEDEVLEVDPGVVIDENDRMELNEVSEEAHARKKERRSGGHQNRSKKEKEDSSNLGQPQNGIIRVEVEKSGRKGGDTHNSVPIRKNRGKAKDNTDALTMDTAKMPTGISPVTVGGDTHNKIEDLDGTKKRPRSKGSEEGLEQRRSTRILQSQDRMRDDLSGAGEVDNILHHGKEDVLVARKGREALKKQSLQEMKENGYGSTSPKNRTETSNESNNCCITESDVQVVDVTAKSIATEYDANIRHEVKETSKPSQGTESRKARLSTRSSRSQDTKTPMENGNNGSGIVSDITPEVEIVDEEDGYVDTDHQDRRVGRQRATRKGRETRLSKSQDDQELQNNRKSQASQEVESCSKGTLEKADDIVIVNITEDLEMEGKQMSRKLPRSKKNGKTKLSKCSRGRGGSAERNRETNPVVVVEITAQKDEAKSVPNSGERRRSSRLSKSQERQNSGRIMDEGNQGLRNISGNSCKSNLDVALFDDMVLEDKGDHSEEKDEAAKRNQSTKKVSCSSEKGVSTGSSTETIEIDESSLTYAESEILHAAPNKKAQTKDNISEGHALLQDGVTLQQGPESARKVETGQASGRSTRSLRNRRKEQALGGMEEELPADVRKEDGKKRKSDRRQNPKGIEEGEGNSKMEISNQFGIGEQLEKEQVPEKGERDQCDRHDVGEDVNSELQEPSGRGCGMKSEEKSDHNDMCKVGDDEMVERSCQIGATNRDISNKENDEKAVRSVEEGSNQGLQGPGDAEGEELSPDIFTMHIAEKAGEEVSNEVMKAADRGSKLSLKAGKGMKRRKRKTFAFGNDLQIDSEGKEETESKEEKRLDSVDINSDSHNHVVGESEKIREKLTSKEPSQATAESYISEPFVPATVGASESSGNIVGGLLPGHRLRRTNNKRSNPETDQDDAEDDGNHANSSTGGSNMTRSTQKGRGKRLPAALGENAEMANKRCRVESKKELPSKQEEDDDECSMIPPSQPAPVGLSAGCGRKCTRINSPEGGGSNSGRLKSGQDDEPPNDEVSMVEAFERLEKAEQGSSASQKKSADEGSLSLGSPSISLLHGVEVGNVNGDGEDKGGRADVVIVAGKKDVDNHASLDGGSVSSIHVIPDSNDAGDVSMRAKTTFSSFDQRDADLMVSDDGDEITDDKISRSKSHKISSMALKGKSKSSNGLEEITTDARGYGRESVSSPRGKDFNIDSGEDENEVDVVKEDGERRKLSKSGSAEKLRKEKKMLRNQAGLEMGNYDVDILEEGAVDSENELNCEVGDNVANTKKIVEEDEDFQTEEGRDEELDSDDEELKAVGLERDEEEVEGQEQGAGDQGLTEGNIDEGQVEDKDDLEDIYDAEYGEEPLFDDDCVSQGSTTSRHNLTSASSVLSSQSDLMNSQQEENAKETLKKMEREIAEMEKALAKEAGIEGGRHEETGRALAEEAKIEGAVAVIHGDESEDEDGSLDGRHIVEHKDDPELPDYRSQARRSSTDGSGSCKGGKNKRNSGSCDKPEEDERSDSGRSRKSNRSISRSRSGNKSSLDLKNFGNIKDFEDIEDEELAADVKENMSEMALAEKSLNQIMKKLASRRREEENEERERRETEQQRARAAAQERDNCTPSPEDIEPLPNSPRSPSPPPVISQRTLLRRISPLQKEMEKVDKIKQVTEGTVCSKVAPESSQKKRRRVVVEESSSEEEGENMENPKKALKLDSREYEKTENQRNVPRPDSLSPRGETEASATGAEKAVLGGKSKSKEEIAEKVSKAEIAEKSADQDKAPRTSPTQTQNHDQPTTSTSGGTNGGRPRKKPRKGESMSLITTGLNKQKMKLVDQLCKKAGCRFSSAFSSETTHVIVNADEDLTCERTLKYFQGIAARRWIISYQWVHDSLSASRLLPQEKYEVRGDTVNGRNHCGPKRARLWRGPLLLADYNFFCLGPYTGLSTDQIHGLLSSCGGTIIDHPGNFPQEEGKENLIIAQADASQTPRDYNALFQKIHVPIISREWVLDSIAVYTAQPIDDYLLCDVPNDDDMEEFDSGDEF